VKPQVLDFLQLFLLGSTCELKHLDHITRPSDIRISKLLFHAWIGFLAVIEKWEKRRFIPKAFASIEEIWCWEAISCATFLSELSFQSDFMCRDEEFELFKMPSGSKNLFKNQLLSHEVHDLKSPDTLEAGLSSFVRHRREYRRS
jgi:hypothetical protein